MTIHAFQRSLEQKLTELGAESPRFDAAQLLRWLSGQEQAWLIAHAADPCPEDWQSRAEDALTRLRSGEPLQYLLGCHIINKHRNHILSQFRPLWI